MIHVLAFRLERNIFRQKWHTSHPTKALPCTKIRVLTYYSPKSVHNNCDPVEVFKKQNEKKRKKNKRTSETSMWGCAGEVGGWPIPMKFGNLVEWSDVMKCAEFHRSQSLTV